MDRPLLLRRGTAPCLTSPLQCGPVCTWVCCPSASRRSPALLSRTLCAVYGRISKGEETQRGGVIISRWAQGETCAMITKLNIQRNVLFHFQRRQNSKCLSLFRSETSADGEGEKKGSPCTLWTCRRWARVRGSGCLWAGRRSSGPWSPCWPSSCVWVHVGKFLSRCTIVYTEIKMIIINIMTMYYGGWIPSSPFFRN